MAPGSMVVVVDDMGMRLRGCVGLARWRGLARQWSRAWGGDERIAGVLGDGFAGSCRPLRVGWRAVPLVWGGNGLGVGRRVRFRRAVGRRGIRLRFEGERVWGCCVLALGW